MTPCSFDALDAWVMGELDVSEIPLWQEHVSTCAMCELQLRRLRKDRMLLAASQRSPAFDATALRANVERTVASKRKAKRLAFRTAWASAVSAAALALLLFRTGTPSVPSPVDSTTLSDVSVACWLPARWEDPSIASAETTYGACLLASPRSLPERMALCL